MLSLRIQAFVGEILFLTERAMGFYILIPPSCLYLLIWIIETIYTQGRNFVVSIMLDPFLILA